MDKLLCWNVRGLNKLAKQKMVKKLIEYQGVGLVWLQETRVKASKLGALYLNVFQGWCFTSNLALHKGGRIVVAWNPSIFKVNKIECSKQLVHLELILVDRDCSFNVTIVYGFNKAEGRKDLW